MLCLVGHENMIDWENLEKRPLSKLLTAEGFMCQVCGTWKHLYYSTPQLEEKMRRLTQMSPAHPSFQYHFVKTFKRAQEVQRRGRISANGTI